MEAGRAPRVIGNGRILQGLDSLGEIKYRRHIGEVAHEDAKGPQHKLMWVTFLKGSVFTNTAVSKFSYIIQ